MNNKFILPAAFALACHAFLLFGLTDKPSRTVAPTEDTSTTEKLKWLPIDTEKPTTDPADREIESTPGGPTTSLPRLPDFVVVQPPLGAPTVPPLPPVAAGAAGPVIDPHWELPGRPNGNSGVKPFGLGDLDRIPRARLQPAPIYPSDLRRQGIEGTVVVDFKVDVDGSVYSTTVVEATNPGFIDAALRAVERWKFEPGRKMDKKVRFHMCVPIVFNIDRP